MRGRKEIVEIIKKYALEETEKCLNYSITNKDGYGDLRYLNEEGKKRHYLAHRLSYEVFNNVLLQSTELILHSCDNPSCVNPKHLRIGTHKDNSEDKVSRNRQAKGKNNGRYVNGYKSIYDKVEKPKANFQELFSRKLGLEKVLILKEAIKNRGSKSLKILSEEFEISYSTIKDLSCGRVYNNA